MSNGKILIVEDDAGISLGYRCFFGLITMWVGQSLRGGRTASLR
jgi:hypothetical protein